MKKVLLLNLPNRERVTRRYMCSYVSPESLLPPIELISVGAVAREWLGAEIVLIDAIAEGWDSAAVALRVRSFAPDVVVSITGFECFEDDMAELRALGPSMGDAAVVLFGHYATHFPKETLHLSGADYVILGEPELVFKELMEAIAGRAPLDGVNGLALMTATGVSVQGKGGRIPVPEALPMPAYDLLPGPGSYFEPLLPKPFGMIQTARGCPYRCNYCVKSYGSKLTELSPGRIVQEIREWQRLHRVRSIRFIDDTFTLNRKRVMDICTRILEEGIRVEWACLSRTDNLDAELLARMKEAGCRRIYFGMESGSQRMLDIYDKQMDAGLALEVLLMCREAGIETAAFFMSGHPEETEEDFHHTVRFAKKARLSFASFNPLTLYPGTPIFTAQSDKVEFSIHPYVNRWKDPSVHAAFAQRKKRFYRSFYLRTSYFSSNWRLLARHSAELAKLGLSMLRYLVWDGKFVISGLKGPGDK